MLKIFFLLFIIFSNLIFSYPFTIPSWTEEYFLYPFLNYDHSDEWKKAREGKLYEGSSIQLSYGSLTTYDLMNRVTKNPLNFSSIFNTWFKYNTVC
ncbi:MAG: hypothetical protein KKD38_01300 [Candidatus Delongbacteria bacterium]|nr:hypothetical protein [Candidatus Delongbacteria bacterium]MCG2760373.1 hypothetical protein [Candidatus Delongbacteria bacterium]